jgi:hypothetical protein
MTNTPARQVEKSPGGAPGEASRLVISEAIQRVTGLVVDSLPGPDPAVAISRSRGPADA